MAAAKKPTSSAKSTAPLTFASLPAWLAWLAEHHASSRGVWLRIAKKDGGQRSVTYAEAIEGALIWGWIDGQKNKLDDTHWLQRFSPRAQSSFISLNSASVSVTDLFGGIANVHLGRLKLPPSLF